MSYSQDNIYTSIKQDKCLCKKLLSVDDITLMEYNGKNIEGSRAIACLLKDLGHDENVVRRVCLFGKPDEAIDENGEEEKQLFPNAEITIVGKPWSEIDAYTLMITSVLVLHFATDLYEDDPFENYFSDVPSQLTKFLDETRQAYYACFLRKRNKKDLFDNECVIESRLDLSDLHLIKSKEIVELSEFCKDKSKAIDAYFENLNSESTFFQCMDELTIGCETCNLSSHYGRLHYCPKAQRAIARCYREGIFVPQDAKIAHQWEQFASRQGYRAAIIQVADDLCKGEGCEKDVDRAYEIYAHLIDKSGSKDLCRKIIQLADDGEIASQLSISFIARLANDGDEEMTLLLYDAFGKGRFGLPRDMEQQKAWIEKGALNGNVRLMKAMAEMYESHETWAEAYEWWKRLKEKDDTLVSDGKIEKISMKMLTEGCSADDVAERGKEYLFGFFGKEQDIPLAIRYFNFAKSEGSAKAIGLLGFMYVHGIGFDKDEEKGNNLFTEASARGDLMSKYEVATSPDENLGINYELLDQLLTRVDRSLDNGEAVVFYLKSFFETTGLVCVVDEYSAFYFMKKAAELNMPEAQYDLAKMYKEGEGVDEDESQYRYWLEKSAKNGYFLAEGELGTLRFEERELNKETFTLLHKACELDYGDLYIDPKALWALAKCYMHGYGTKADRRKAYSMYIKVAESNIVEAQEQLREAYFRGNEYLKKNYKECVRWGERAIAHGSKDIRFETAFASSETGNHDRAKELYLELSNEGNATAMNNYACELSDSTEKFEWFKKAADHGEEYGWWNMGKLYRDGDGVEQNDEKAVECFATAAEKGQKYAMEALASMYLEGRGVDQDSDKAIEWYLKAAQNGETDALTKVAEIYRYGKGITQEASKAISYYKQAAEKGDIGALVNLGSMYENGEGVEKDIHSAVTWYRKAAAKDNSVAQECLNRLGADWIDKSGKVIKVGNDENSDNDNA